MVNKIRRVPAAGNWSPLEATDSTDSTDSAELRQSSSCDNPANDPAADLQNASLFHPLGNQGHIVAT